MSGYLNFPVRFARCIFGGESAMGAPWCKMRYSWNFQQQRYYRAWTDLT